MNQCLNEPTTVNDVLRELRKLMNKKKVKTQKTQINKSTYGKHSGNQANKLNIEEDVDFKILDFSWGRSCNLFIYCLELKSGIRFEFSVFNNNEYSARDESLNFKNIKDGGENEVYVRAKFSRSRNGYLNCMAAKIINPGDFIENPLPEK